MVDACRTYTIEAESRTFTIDDDGTGNEITEGATGVTPIGMLLMIHQVTATGWVVSGTPTGRTLVVEAEDRTYAIEC